MNLDDLIKTNPIVILAIAILGITLIVYKLIPSINSLVEAALTRRGWKKDGQDTESDIDPIQILTELNRQTQEAVKALVITLQLQIETNNQRDSAAAQRDNRIGTLADMVMKSIEVGTKNVENIGRLTESIAQLALTGNNQSNQLSQQTLKLSELVGQYGATRQLGEDTSASIARAVQSVDENKQSIDDLKVQVEKLERDVREDLLPMLQQKFLPMLGGIREAIDGLATKSDLAQMGEFTNKLNLIEAEIKALIVTMAIAKPSEAQDVPAAPPASAVVEKPHEAQPAPKPPKEDKPDVPPSAT